jgi:hypothetical protein
MVRLTYIFIHPQCSSIRAAYCASTSRNYCQFAPLLIFGCLVFFLWPTTVFVEVSDTGRRRKEEENRTEVVTEELLAEVTESSEDTTTIFPRLV